MLWHREAALLGSALLGRAGRSAGCCDRGALGGARWRRGVHCRAAGAGHRPPRPALHNRPARRGRTEAPLDAGARSGRRPLERRPRRRRHAVPAQHRTRSCARRGAAHVRSRRRRTPRRRSGRRAAPPCAAASTRWRSASNRPRAGTIWCCPSRRSRRCGRSPRTCGSGSRSTRTGASRARARAGSASARCSPARAAPARPWPRRCWPTSCDLDLYRIDLAVDGQQVHRRDGEEPAPRVRRRRGQRRDPAVRRGRRAVRQAQRGQGQPRPLRQHRGQLPAAAHGGVPRARDSDHQPQGRARPGVPAPPALRRRSSRFRIRQQRERIWRGDLSGPRRRSRTSTTRSWRASTSPAATSATSR